MAEVHREFHDKFGIRVISSRRDVPPQYLNCRGNFRDDPEILPGLPGFADDRSAPIPSLESMPISRLVRGVAILSRAAHFRETHELGRMALATTLGDVIHWSNCCRPSPNAEG